MTAEPPDWPHTDVGWPALTSTDPVVDGILRDLFAESHGPGVRVELDVGDRAAVLSGDGPVSWTVDGEVQESVHLAEILFRAVGLLNRRALDADPERLHLHAAQVGDGRRTVLVPGVRGAGKTTLASALLDLGWSYGTDEMVAVEPGGAAAALRKPLNCKPGSLKRFEHVRRLRHRALEHWPTDRAQLGIPPRWLAAGPMSVTDIVVPVRSNRYHEPHLMPLSPADAVRVLAENTFDFERFGPAPSLDVLSALVARARAWTLLHDDAVASASLLDAGLRGPTVDDETGSAPPDIVRLPALAEPGNGTDACQAPGTLGVAIGGHGVIWAPDPGRVVQVAPAALAAWATADGTTTLAQRATGLGARIDHLARMDAELEQAGLIRDARPADRAASTGSPDSGSGAEARLGDGP